MTALELEKTLDNLRSLPSETEVVEFKEAKDGYDFHKIGKYFSAVANESNLKDIPFGWLVFGIEDKAKTIVGTNYRPDKASLDKLKKEIADKITNRISFRDIHEITVGGKRVVMFQIPAAPKGIPVAWEGNCYGRDGESLGLLNLEKIERIRHQLVYQDWSAGICDEATINDLDPKAIQKARENYKGKFPEKTDDVDSWDDITFLNKAKVTVKGKITRTAIILLGRSESEHFIGPSMAKIRWILKGTVSDSQIESCRKTHSKGNPEPSFHPKSQKLCLEIHSEFGNKSQSH